MYICVCFFLFSRSFIHSYSFDFFDDYYMCARDYYCDDAAAAADEITIFNNNVRVFN